MALGSLLVALPLLYSLFHGPRGYLRQLRLKGLAWAYPFMVRTCKSADGEHTMLYYAISRFQDGPLYSVAVLSRHGLSPKWEAPCSYPPFVPEVDGWARPEERAVRAVWEGPVAMLWIDGYLVAAYDAKKDIGEAVDLTAGPPLSDNYEEWARQWKVRERAVLRKLGLTELRQIPVSESGIPSAPVPQR